MAGLHVLHWWRTGRTITPVEPSEAMQTLGEGLVNAGFVLFVVLILGTMIFGRFFCGWACHIVALQDLCTTLLRKLRIEPRPFRSRLLVYVPLAAAVYMFVAPTVVRLWLGQSFPGLRAHFETDDFWARFPDWPIAVLTFVVCGFVAVWVLGNKGFCTYACPYGGIFGLADRAAPGRIRVTDACDGCAHCTVSCTSNVRVHEEVRTWGMVVDPGCMKCTDCISVCPMGALHYGFGAPGHKRRTDAPPVRPRYDFTWPQEIAMAAIFLVSIVTFLALYDAVPLLMALGLAAITTHVVMTLARLRTDRNVTFARHRLRTAGRMQRRGWVFAVLAVVWTLFTLHSAAVQANALAGQRAVAAARKAPAAPVDALEHGRRLLERARSWGLFESPQLDVRLAAVNAQLGDVGAAEALYRRALAHEPDLPEAHHALARIARERGDLPGALKHLEAVVNEEPEFPSGHNDLAEVLLDLDRSGDAVAAMEVLVARRPHHLPFRVTLAVVTAHDGRVDEALAQLRAIAEAHPEDASSRLMYGLILASEGRLEDALASVRASLRVDPENAEAHYTCARLLIQLRRTDELATHLEEACRLDPFQPTYATAWAALMARSGRADALVAALRARAAGDRAARFRLLHLHRALGHEADAGALAREFE